ncbi:hypothetical protein MAHJHV50_46840 [Mycobacterium avium subsp. hominissuis]
MLARDNKILQAVMPDHWSDQFDLLISLSPFAIRLRAPSGSFQFPAGGTSKSCQTFGSPPMARSFWVYMRPSGPT